MKYTLTAEQMQQIREGLNCTERTYEYPVSCKQCAACQALALLDAAMQAPEATDPTDYADLKKLRRLACKAWRHDLTRQQALDALKNLQNAAQDSYGEHMTDALESPEATAGGDVREAVSGMAGLALALRGMGMPKESEDLRGLVAKLEAALAAAPKGGDVQEAYKARRRMMSEDLTEAELRELENICHPVDDALDAQQAALAAAPKPCEHGCVDGVITAYTLNRGTQKIDCPIHRTKPEAPTELCKVCGQIQAHWHHADNVPAANCHPFAPTDATPKDEETGR